jgi:hypothetical protein
VDLGSSRTLTGAQIYWYSANTRSYAYRIEVSTDNVNFTTISNQTGRTGKGISLDAFSVTARYVRITTTGVNPTGGYAAFYEVSLY